LTFAFSPFLLWLFWRGLAFCPEWHGLWSYFKHPTIAGKTGVYHLHPAIGWNGGSCKILILDSPVASITGISHQNPAKNLLFTLFPYCLIYIPTKSRIWFTIKSWDLSSFLPLKRLFQCFPRLKVRLSYGFFICWDGFDFEHWSLVSSSGTHLLQAWYGLVHD
jgi:hypothetical protein